LTRAGRRKTTLQIEDIIMLTELLEGNYSNIKENFYEQLDGAVNGK
jgi:hypothetical protein